MSIQKMIFKNIFLFFKETLSFLYFLARVIYNGNYFGQLKKSEIDTVAVLANGPSLKEEIPRLTTSKEFKNVEFIVLNYFANEEVFFQIKPKHYCLADPMFFQDTHRKDEVKRLFNLLENKINWKINFYIPANKYKRFIKFSNFKNKYIKIVKVNSTEYFGYELFRNYFYKLGLSMPFPGTVANLAIFVALNKSFKKINLYGVDHTFFNSLCINEKNQICNEQEHFYDTDFQNLKPILRIDNQENYKISDYLYSIMLMFKSHDQLFNYSKYLNIQILNCTNNSLIDSYKRK